MVEMEDIYIYIGVAKWACGGVFSLSVLHIVDPLPLIDLHMLGLELTPLKQNISTHPSDPSLVTYVFFFLFLNENQILIFFGFYSDFFCILRICSDNLNSFTLFNFGSKNIMYYDSNFREA